MNLVERCAKGDEAAYRELVASVEKPLLRFIHRYVGDESAAEDLFQETFVRVIRNAATYRPEASVSTWVFTIARNLCLDLLKSRKRHREVSIDAAKPGEGGDVIDFREALRATTAGPEAVADGLDQQRKLRAAIGNIQGPKREALLLRVYAGLSYQEIAKVTGSPVGTAKFRVHEAVQELAALLKPAEAAGEAFGS